MLTVRPCTLRFANQYVTELHRHHKASQGHKFSMKVVEGNTTHGVVICGRPVARGCNPDEVLEVVRLCTDGTKNACSILYAASARVAKEMGYKSIQSYILESESGVSLEAAGWTYRYSTRGGQWNHTKGKPRRTDQPVCPKKLYSKIFQ